MYYFTVGTLALAVRRTCFLNIWISFYAAIFYFPPGQSTATSENKSDTEKHRA